VALWLALAAVGARTPPVLAGAHEPDPLDEAPETAPSASDPFEHVNRVTFAVNDRIDRWMIEPVTRVYAFIVPAPGRRAVRRALTNLNAPAVFVNDILQLEPKDAAVTAARFTVNTTVGVLGFLDVAERMGLEGHHSDFGQTLALCGVPSGPYLIVPVVGPTTARDGTGYLVDVLFRPTTYILTPGATLLMFTSIQEGSTGIAARDAHADELRALEASSIDYYASPRSAFLQDRAARIWARRQDRGPRARVRQALRALLPAGSEIGDPAPHAGDEPLETLALER
jgi:phospholipid-binding lipoprotein MlaA